MKVGIVGSRDYPHLDAVRQYVATLPKGTTVISGGARGVDRTAEMEARRLNLPVDIWEVHGNPRDGHYVERVQTNGAGAEMGWPLDHLVFRTFGEAAHWRNREMVDEADEVVAFWDGASRGTKYTIDYARAHGVPVKVRE